MPDPLAHLEPGQRSLLREWNGDDWREPVLATLTGERFSSPEWLFERKLDGVRVLAAGQGSRPVLWSRNHKRVDAAYPEVGEALAGQRDRFLVDGEIVAFDGDRTSFARLQSRIHLTDPRAARRTGVPIHYYVFDVLAVDGIDTTRLPLRARKQVLQAMFTFTDPLHYSTHRNTDGEEYFRTACARGWEGLIAKRADSPYLGGRSREWLKFKCVAGQEFVIGGFTEPRGSRTGFGALLIGYYEGGRLRYAGKVGTGYDERTLGALRRRLDRIARERTPFAETVPERTAHWVAPELVAEIEFTEWTTDGKLRHPRYTGLREDKPARDVVRER